MALVFSSVPKTQITVLFDNEGFRCFENLMYILQHNWSKIGFPHSSDASIRVRPPKCFNLLVYTASSEIRVRPLDVVVPFTTFFL